ncbi:MAG: hypothetical protein HYX74_07105 [Acidobacteria bacterium]|nr:hypothetical protein [Acidobacteriota bacterium]
MRSKERERRQLEARKQAIVEALPSFAEVMRGSLFERGIKCGKSSCRCARGQEHASTYLGVSLKGGKTVQITVPAKLLERVEGMVRNYSEFWAAVEEISEINRQLLRKRLLESDPHAKPEP